ncbi:CBS domain-containing protein [Actinomadura rudentiformis]|uniref:CBS domain-containing protein n=1 Tax=Actinomadura rudentiformis TaxID=359158 RepID=A0A6H9ZCH7_9ACTN|nr:CBS domain-containing protein [Actinomadura rudentiformis]KAB2352259.1 CBS domain-containing protein [Actinomadura rudentiformis]
MNARTPLEARTVAQVMTTDLLTITPEESVLMAWELMCQARIHHLPVVSAEGSFMGVVDAQILMATWESAGPGRARRPVRDLLPGSPLLAVLADDPIPTAARAMLSANTDYVAVIDDDRTLIGLLTAHDLINALAGGPTPQPHPRPSMPSLYRMEPVLPKHRPAERPEAMAHPSRTVISPD